jgi:hypothetical protein
MKDEGGDKEYIRSRWNGVSVSVSTNIIHRFQ